MFIIHSNDSKKVIISNKIESIEVDIKNIDEYHSIIKLKINGIKVFSKNSKRYENDSDKEKIEHLKNEIVQLIRIDKEENSKLVREYYINDNANLVKTSDFNLKVDVWKYLWN